MEYINFILDPNNDYLGQTIEYLKLCGVAIAAATVIGVVLGALVSRCLLYTSPSPRDS